MTLTEFLLARIAEDEFTAGMADGDAAAPLRGPFNPARVLAECEAKRRIVEMHPVVGGDCEGCGVEVAHADGCLNLRQLATVYSNHPDYREDWRP